ncbi:MAG: hypothetical protein AB1505_07480 [Candidatus Latescibacterota bacterium]
MTSKERVRRAIAHQQTDRVPIDYAARDEVSQALVRLLGLGPGQSLVECLGVDLRGIGPAFPSAASPLHYADPTTRVQDGVHYDLWGVGFRPNHTAAGFYMDLAVNPLRGAAREADLDRHPWPSADQWDYSTVAAQARAHADYWVWAHSRGVFEISWFLRGFNEFLADLASAPRRARAVMDRVQGYLFARTRRILEAGQGFIDMVEYNDDVGGQGGLLLSPGMWRTHLKKRMADFVALCRPYGVKVR